MNLSSENRLLLYCAQTTIPENRVPRVNDLLSRSLNWESITEIAFSRNIAQLLYHNLKGLPRSHLIPPEVMEDLKRAYHENIARNMYLYAELKQILNAFHRGGLAVIALKGAALAGIVYRDAGLRPMMDIDLLVKEEDLPAAQRIMADLKYIHATSLKSKQWHKENHHHLPTYHHPKNPVIVEIHWHFTEYSLGIDIKKWWERARNENLRGYRILVPSPEDMLIHLCLHLHNHCYESGFVLRGLCDISEVLRHYEDEIDWGLLRDEIKEYGIEKQVHSMLYLARNYYDVRGEALRLLTLSHVDQQFTGILEKSLFIDKGDTSINSHLLKSMALETFPQKAKYLLPKIFPSRVEMANRYPVSPSSPLIFFYYLIHPFHLTLKYGRSVIDILRIKLGSNENK